MVDSTQYPISDVFIRNINAGLITSSKESGAFKIPAKLGDSIVLSFIGYENATKIVDESWLESSSQEFVLSAKTTFLDEVTVTKFPEYQQFKDQILATDAGDTALQVFGVPRVVISKEDRLNASLAIRGPFSAVHNTFSKRAKEQKKLRKILQNQETRYMASTKFNRDWVAELTKLKGDELTSFIAYCNFSETYLANTPEYIIHEDMMELLPKFLEEYNQEG